MKDKKCITIANAFQKILDESNNKSNKIWLVQGSAFYYRSMKSWLKIAAIVVCPIHNERKSVVAEKSIRTLKNKTYKTWLQYQKKCILIN